MHFSKEADSESSVGGYCGSVLSVTEEIMRSFHGSVLDNKGEEGRFCFLPHSAKEELEEMKKGSVSFLVCAYVLHR